MRRAAALILSGAAFALSACSQDEAGARNDAAEANPSNTLAPAWLALTGNERPEEGRYACQDWNGYSVAKAQSDAAYGADIRQSSYFTSQFSITGEGSYVYHGSRPIEGTYSYSPTTGDVLWETGPYSAEPDDEATVSAISGRRESDGKATILQIFRDPSYGEAAELCFKYQEAAE